MLFMLATIVSDRLEAFTEDYIIRKTLQPTVAAHLTSLRAREKTSPDLQGNERTAKNNRFYFDVFPNLHVIDPYM